MDAARAFGGRHALHAVHAAFKLQAAERALALDVEHRFLDAAQLRHVVAHGLQLQAVALGVARVHAKQDRAEQRRFVPARALADFHDHVAVVVRVAGNQQQPQLVFLRFAALDKAFQLVSRHIGHLGHGEHVLGFGNLPARVFDRRGRPPPPG